MSVDGEAPPTDEAAEGDLEAQPEQEGKLDEDILEHFNSLGLAPEECVRFRNWFRWWLHDM